MRYAFMTFSTPHLTLDEVLALAARLGYDGVEPRIDADHRHGMEIAATAAERASMRRRAEDAGVAIACVATSCRFADPAERATNMARAIEAIDLAAGVGARRIRVFGGPIPAELGRPEAVEGVAGALLSVARRAAARGVTVCLETHDDWCDPRDVAAVLRAVNSPAVGANWDVVHPVRTGLATVDESFEILNPWIAHLHVHDGQAGDGAIVPIGEGIVDHRRVLALLAALPYDGFLSGEWIGWEPYEVHLPRELATLRAYEDGLAARA